MLGDTVAHTLRFLQSPTGGRDSSDFMRLMASAKTTVDRVHGLPCAVTVFTVSPHYQDGANFDEPAPLCFEVRTSPGPKRGKGRKAATYSAFFAQGETFRAWVFLLPGQGPAQFSRTSQEYIFDEADAEWLHAEALASDQFFEWVVRTLDYFRTHGRM